MSGQRIGVEVDRAGLVRARRWEDDARSPAEQIGYGGLDATLVGLFERWLTLRDRLWRDDEVRAFGDLLHRCLFPRTVWSWLEAALDDADEPVRLSLSFPADPPYSRLAAVPWEYLHSPDRAGRRGVFLAYEPGVVLSRYIPLEAGVGTLRTEDAVRVLVVVSQPDDRRLGQVVAAPVLDAVRRSADELGYEVEVVSNPTVVDFRRALERVRPHLVHFMGHGEFDPASGSGSLAFSAAGGGADWLDDRGLAALLQRSRPVPRVVILHACEGARADFAASFAGVAPQLVRGGVQCVVAMQYAVTNETAISFSTSFYEELAGGRPLDEAVQECRWRISTETRRDPRLIGVPVVYFHSRDGLLRPVGAAGPGEQERK